MCASSFPPGRSRSTINELQRYRPIALVAAQRVAKRPLLYAASFLGVFAVQALFLHFVHVKFSWFYAALIGAPLLNAIVILNVGADASGTLPTPRSRIERFLDRAWAIVVLDAGITLVGQVGYDSIASGDASSILQGVLVMFLAAMLIYAEPFACLEGETQIWTIIPYALLRSMMMAWVNISRIFALFAVQIAVTIGGLFVYKAFAATPEWSDIASLAYNTFVSGLLAGLFTVAYLDTLAMEQSAQK